MTMSKYIDKADPLLLLEANDMPFYGVAAPAGIKPENYKFAEAYRTLLGRMVELQDVGDVLRPDQIETINAAYAEAYEILGVAAIRAENVGLKLTAGRYKSQIKRLKEALGEKEPKL
jgi:hypothetical protein